MHTSWAVEQISEICIYCWFHEETARDPSFIPRLMCPALASAHLNLNLLLSCLPGIPTHFVQDGEATASEPQNSPGSAATVPSVLGLLPACPGFSHRRGESRWKLRGRGRAPDRCFGIESFTSQPILGSTFSGPYLFAALQIQPRPQSPGRSAAPSRTSTTP